MKQVASPGKSLCTAAATRYRTGDVSLGIFGGGDGPASPLDPAPDRARSERRRSSSTLRAETSRRSWSFDSRRSCTESWRSWLELGIAEISNSAGFSCRNLGDSSLNELDAAADAPCRLIISSASNSPGEGELWRFHKEGDNIFSSRELPGHGVLGQEAEAGQGDGENFSRPELPGHGVLDDDGHGEGE